MLKGLWPSFETRPSKSAVADFDTVIKCRSQAGLTSVDAPQDEVGESLDRAAAYFPGCLKYRRSGGAWSFLIGMM